MFLFFSATLDCRVGDGKSESEIKLSGIFTKENCITAVKEQHPTANGATMQANCTSKCSCWAEFGMTAWMGSNYQSCMFIEDDIEDEHEHEEGR